MGEDRVNVTMEVEIEKRNVLGHSLHVKQNKMRLSNEKCSICYTIPQISLIALKAVL